jgi:predicted transcriptional regulator
MSVKIKDIVRQARGDMSQVDFARKIGKSQGLLSKYEAGVVNPPAETIEQCLRMIGSNGVQTVLSSASLAKRVRAELKGPNFAYARKAITAILDGAASG